MRNQKGITLIALVITIIVLLILAGVSIAMLTGDNGILTNSQNAKKQTAMSEAEEKIDLCLNAIKTEIYAQQVSDKTYSGIDDDDAIDSAITAIIAKDLSPLDTTATTYSDEKYSYNLNGTTLTIYYQSTTNDFQTSGSIVLTNVTSNVTITAAVSTDIPAGE